MSFGEPCESVEEEEAPRLEERLADPLQGWRIRRLVRLARRAHRGRGRGAEVLGRLAERADVSPRRLRLLADAWAEGGRSGIVALGPAPAVVDQAAVQRMDGALEAWRRRHYPLEALRWDSWRNRLTVWQLVVGADRRGELDRRPLCQLRLTPDGRWHLYRKAVLGEWWPVAVMGRRAEQGADSCLDAVRADVLGVFWNASSQALDSPELWFDPRPRQ